MRYLSVSMVTLALISSGTLAPAAGEPAVVVWEGRHMAAVKSLVAQPSDELKRALRNVQNAADDALERGPYSVMHKNELPPSGNKHDYLSYSRYWWPNPDTEDGLPYVRRDGKTNTKIRARGDRDRIGQLYQDVEALSLAYYFFEDEKYAQHASHLIRTWFLDAETKMNPHLNYAQAVPGRSEGRGVGIIDTRGFIMLLDCVALLQDSASFSGQDHEQLEQWFSEFLVWLQTSELGKDEQSAENNHGSWYAAQAARIALFVGEEQLARKIVLHTAKQRIPDQFRSDGSQPYENKRTKSLHYCFFNLSALSVVARVGEQLGINLWDSSGSEGDNLKRGLAHVLPYLTKQSTWPHQQLDRYELSPKIIQLLRQASVRYQDARFATVIEKVGHRHRDHNYAELVCAVHDLENPRVEILEDGKQALAAYELPDISHYTVESIMKLLPKTRSGRAKVDLAENYPLLDESFRRKRGQDLQKRQGVEKTRTIVVTGGAISLSQLVQQLGDAKIASQEGSIVTLRLPLLIQPGGTLIVEGSAVETLRLSTDRGAFIANAGTLFVTNSAVTSWDENQRQPSLFADSREFRPFISSYVRSQTYLAGSRFEHLGFLAPTAYGLSLSSHPERERGAVREDWPTGQLLENEFIGLYYGFYSYEARDVAIVGNTYDDSIRYGIDPHDRSTRLIIAKNITKRTRERHGIIGSRGVSHSFIFQNTTHNNHGSGIMLDRQCSEIVVAENQVFKNGQGIAVYESPNNLVADNWVISNQKSGVRIRNSTGVKVQKNVVASNGDYAFEVYSKRLADHEKRASRGDLYEKLVKVMLQDNVATGNRGGCVKGSNIQSLALTDLRTQLAGSERNRVAELLPAELDTEDDDEFGSELKPFAKKLRRAFESDSPLVLYSH